MNELEAGGIEPPSRDGIQDASTCIVDRLFLGSADAGRQAAAFPSPTVSYPRAVRRRTRASLLVSSGELAGVIRATGYGFLRSHGKRVVAI